MMQFDTFGSSTEPTLIGIFQELAVELQTHRSGVHGDKMAQDLLRFKEGCGPSSEG